MEQHIFLKIFIDYWERQWKVSQFLMLLMKIYNKNYYFDEQKCIFLTQYQKWYFIKTPYVNLTSLKCLQFNYACYLIKLAI